MATAANTSFNRLAQTAYDFANWTSLANATAAGAFGPTSAPDHTNERTPSSTNPTGFQPKGRLQRALMVTNGSARLTAVREVQLGQATYTTNNNGTLTVVARLAEHRLRAGGSTGTVPLSGYTLRLTNQIVLTNWTANTGAWAATTDANGVATFSMTNLASVHGVCRLAAWLDGGTANSFLDPHRDAWASHTYSLGTVVELTASPDVGDDKNTATGKRAKIRATRTGATNASLVVNLTQHSGVYFKPNTSSDLAGTYGTTGTADYYVTSGTGTWSASSPYTSATLKIPAGSATSEVSVVTRADELTEQNLIVCRLAQSTAYAPGVSTNVHVLIFDGPEWTVLEVDLDNLGPTYSSAAYAVNDVNGGTQPYVAGYGTYYSSPNYYSQGGWWPLPGVVFAYSENLPYRGVSTSPVLFVGTFGSSARVKPLSGAAYNLPHLHSSPSTAWGVNGDATVIAGSGKNAAGTVRPVAWTGSGGSYTAQDLATALDAAWTGTAYGANASKQVAGRLYVEYDGGWSGEVGFRSKSGTSVQSLAFDSDKGLDCDIFRAPGIALTAGANEISSASAVSTAGAAVGWYRPNASVTNAVFWPGSDEASDAVVIDLKPWKAKQGTGLDTRSMATSVNSDGWIVGWSGTSGPARAVLKRWASDVEEYWEDLNDKHFVHGTSGWILKEATAINNTGHIVGQGTLNGNTRGFVLIRRTAGN